MVSQVDVGKGLPFLYHCHVGHWPGLSEAGRKFLDPLTKASLPNETRRGFSPAVPMEDSLSLYHGSRLGLEGLPSPMSLAIQQKPVWP